LPIGDDIMTKPLADPDELHHPARAGSMESLEEHLTTAANLARALWNAIDGLDSGTDERDKLALYELAGAVADHASAARYAFYLQDERSAARAIEDIETDPVFPALEEWKRLRDAEGSDAAAAFEANVLLKTYPTSGAGALALLRFLAARVEGDFAVSVVAVIDVIEREAASR
jgi:hypothetical protein